MLLNFSSPNSNCQILVVVTNFSLVVMCVLQGFVEFVGLFVFF